MSKLTTKQQAFVDCYTGNATEAARMAGYKGNLKTLAQVGAENLRKPYILEAINIGSKNLTEKRISTRTERKQFWTEIMKDRTRSVRDRLMASKLLGQSECDFIQVVETLDLTHEEWLDKMREEDADGFDPPETLH